MSPAAAYVEGCPRPRGRAAHCRRDATRARARKIKGRTRHHKGTTRPGTGPHGIFQPNTCFAHNSNRYFLRISLRNDYSIVIPLSVGLSENDMPSALMIYPSPLRLPLYSLARLLVVCDANCFHMLGDWIIQTDAQAMAKMKSWRAMAGHVLTYHLTMAVLVPPFRHDRWAVLGFVVSAATHGFIDRRWPVRLLLSKTGSKSFAETTLGVLAADQALHAVFLAFMAVLYQVTR